MLDGDARERFPSALQALLLVLALFLAEYAWGALLYDARHALGLEELEQVWALAILLSYGTLLTLAMHFLKLGHRQLFHPSQASLSATAGLLLPLVACLVPGLLLSIGLLLSAVVQVLPLSNAEVALFKTLSSDSLAMHLMVCVMAPLLEEMLFRGVVLRGFLARYPRWPAIVGSALLFGVAHLNVYQFLVGLVMGTLLGWLYERSRSLLPCVALHAAYNLGWLAIADTKRQIGPLDAPDWMMSLPVWAAAAALAWVGVAGLRRVLGAGRAPR